MTVHPTLIRGLNFGKQAVRVRRAGGDQEFIVIIVSSLHTTLLYTFTAISKTVDHIDQNSLPEFELKFGKSK